MYRNVRSLARGLAVVFAISVTGFLIIRAQRSAGVASANSSETRQSEATNLQGPALYDKVRQALTADKSEPIQDTEPLVFPPFLPSSKSFQMVDKELSGEIEGLVFPPPAVSPFPNGQHPTPAGTEGGLPPSGIPPSGALLPSSKFAPLDLLPESNEPSKVDG